MSTWKLHFPQLVKNKRYSVIRKIGEGGMAVVFQCIDKQLDDTVALKILKPDLVNVKDIFFRFKQEIKIARKISHRNICRIYDFGSFEDLSYIVMEYLEGVPLSSVVRIKGAIPDERKLKIAIRILQGLEAAHQLRIVHRDLKPSNIMIIKNLEPVITDFGLASHSGNQTVTPADHSLFGTPAYMSPEQIVGKQTDHRADIYAFGLIFYELMTTSYPYDDTNYFKLLYSHINEEPAPPNTLIPELDNRVNDIILKCVAKEPDVRYQCASDVLTEIMATYDYKQPEATQKESKKVLVVDDEKAVLNMLNRMFQSFGMNVLISNNGQDAITKAMSEHLDLICLDIMMPEMTGFEVAEILLSNPKTKNVPIVILTAKNDTEYMQYSRQLGVLDYITKPIHRADIEKRLNYWLQ